MTICQNNTNGGCASLYVTVTGNGCSYYGCNGNLNLGQTSLSLNVGQNSTVSISGTSGYYYVSNNSNSSVTSATISGSSLYVSGLAAGTSTITICQSSTTYACVSLVVTVTNYNNNYNNYNNSLLWFTQGNMNLSMGQNNVVTIYSNSYSGSYYISNNSNSSVASPSISGNTLTVYGLNNGTSTITVCQSGNYTCGNVYVTVGNTYYGGVINISPTNLVLSYGQSGTATISGSGNGNYYYISSNSNTNVANANVANNIINVTANNMIGTTTVVVCQSNTSACANLYVTVNLNNYGYNSGYSNNYNNNYNYNTGSGSLQYPVVPSSNVLGATTFANGQLLKEGDAVYIVYRGTKTGFSSASVFTGLGFKFSNAFPIANSGLVDSGYTVRTANAQHPWGTWIKDGGNTIYFVHESGLIPVPDYVTFVNNGGQDSLIVKGSVYDFRLPVLSAMTMGDGRLR